MLGVPHRYRVGLVALGWVASCGGSEEPLAAPAGADAVPAHVATAPPLFVEVQDQAGLDFVHASGATGKKYFPETMGGGGGFFDYDNDGDLDVYLVQSGPIGPEGGPPLPNRLFENRGDGTFEDVTEASGAGDTGYGMGCAFADVDGNGWTDVYVTNFGRNVLLLNEGGTFRDATDVAGVGDDGWGAGCSFADYDADGDMDLYVVNYLSFTLATHRFCKEKGHHVYCHPDAYAGVPDVLFRNDGEGRFSDVTREAGVYVGDPDEAKGLGCAWFDFDQDGWLDLYVSNDSTRNFLFKNLRDGSFEEVGIPTGVAYNEWGQTEAGMGIAVGDLDEDGFDDLLVTHLDMETNTLYRNTGSGAFEDRTKATGVGAASVRWVGFGVGFFDYDNDGDLDVYVANGHIIDNIADIYPGSTHGQRDQLLENLGNGRLSDVSDEAGPWFEEQRVGRGMVFGDYDEDGDLDVLVVNWNAPVVLLRNEIGSEADWLGLRLETSSGDAAVGARAVLTVDGQTRQRTCLGAASYLSQGDPRVFFGLDGVRSIESLVVHWPGGERTELDVESVPRRTVTRVRAR